MSYADKVSRRLERIGPQHFQERFAMWFEDFDIGDVYEHWPGRTVTEADNMWQSLLQMNPHPLHLDDAYGAQTEFGRVVVSSLVTLPLVHGMSVACTSANAIANLGWDSIRLTAPVFVGDTVYAASRVIDKRLSASRLGHGVVKVATEGKKSDGQVFMTFERSFLIATRAHASSQAQ